jgi:hypothetical protein
MCDAATRLRIFFGYPKDERTPAEKDYREHCVPRFGVGPHVSL